MKSNIKCGNALAFVTFILLGLLLLFPSASFAEDIEDQEQAPDYYLHVINSALDKALSGDPEIRENGYLGLNELAGPSAETLRILLWYHETEDWFQKKLLFQIFVYSPVPLEQMKTLLIENMPAFRKGEIEHRTKMINRILAETPEEYFFPRADRFIREPKADPSKFIQLIPPEYLLIEHEKKNAAIRQSGVLYASTVRKLLWIMEKDPAMQRLLLEQTIANDKEESGDEYTLKEMLTIAARFQGEEQAKRSAMLREVWATIGTTVDPGWKPPLPDFADSETQEPPNGGAEGAVAEASPFPWVIVILVAAAAFSAGAISTILLTRAKKSTTSK